MWLGFNCYIRHDILTFAADPLAEEEEAEDGREGPDADDGPDEPDGPSLLEACASHCGRWSTRFIAPLKVLQVYSKALWTDFTTVACEMAERVVCAGHAAAGRVQGAASDHSPPNSQIYLRCRSPGQQFPQDGVQG
jgi:hypothetical protein